VLAEALDKAIFFATERDDDDDLLPALLFLKVSSTAMSPLRHASACGPSFRLKGNVVKPHTKRDRTLITFK
jgi:hypothetical protein